MLSAILSGCGSPSTAPGPTIGRLQVRAATDTVPPGFLRYTLRVDGTDGPALRPDDIVTLERVSAGEHTIELVGLHTDCAVEGINPRAVIVEGGLTATVDFSVICRLPVLSGFRLVVATTGGRPDENGYLVTIDGARSRRVGAQDTVEVAPLAPGSHLVALSDVAEQCQVQGDNPRKANVVPGKRVQLRLPVVCGD